MKNLDALARDLVVAGVALFPWVALAEEPVTPLHAAGGTTKTGLAVETAPSHWETWQQRMLFEPSEQQLRMEERGRVMIYSGMRESDVEAAMKEHFGRIEHFMFIRTISTDESGIPLLDESGKAMVSDDDC